jgi:hypothetical protein
MGDDEKGKPDWPSKMKEIAEEAADILDDYRKAYSEKAQDAGYSRDLLRGAAGYYGRLPNHPGLETSVTSLAAFRDYLKEKGEDVKSAPTFAGTSFTVVTTASAASAVSIRSLDMPSVPSMPSFPGRLGHSPIRGGLSYQFTFGPPPFEPPGAELTYAGHLDKLDPELGRVYRSVWETLRGTTFNPERIALEQMRQAFDHFFDRLAPDDEVRSSPHFSRKEGADPNKIHRRERILYAADRHIRDRQKANLLSSQAGTILGTYNELNKLHERGALDVGESRQTLVAMDRILREWIDALGL